MHDKRLQYPAAVRRIFPHGTNTRRRRPLRSRLQTIAMSSMKVMAEVLDNSSGSCYSPPGNRLHTGVHHRIEGGFDG